MLLSAAFVMVSSAFLGACVRRALAPSVWSGTYEALERAAPGTALPLRHCLKGWRGNDNLRGRVLQRTNALAASAKAAVLLEVGYLGSGAGYGYALIVDGKVIRGLGGGTNGTTEAMPVASRRLLGELLDYPLAPKVDVLPMLDGTCYLLTVVREGVVSQVGSIGNWDDAPAEWKNDPHRDPALRIMALLVEHVEFGKPVPREYD